MNDMNTRIEFASIGKNGRQVWHEAVVSGVVTKNQIRIIMRCLEDGEFIPGRVNLVSASDRAKGFGSQWCTLDEADFHKTHMPENTGISADELVAAFQDAFQKRDNVLNGWEDVNTRVYYLYRDGSNYKVMNGPIIAGCISKKQEEEIRACLDGGELFIPAQVGLPEVRCDRQYTEDDTPWFELCDFCITSTRPTVPTLTVNDLVAAFKRAKDNWDEDWSSED